MMNTVVTEAGIEGADEAAAGMREKISMMNIVATEAGVVVADEAAAGMRRKILMMNIVATEAVAVAEEAVVDEAGEADRIAVVKATMTTVIVIAIATAIATAIVIKATMTRVPNKRKKIVLQKNGN